MKSPVNVIMLAALLSLAVVGYPVAATEFFVSGTGSDHNDGSQGRPFQTLERAAEEMKPGDVCWLRQGRYRSETRLEGLRGQPGKPYSFKSFPGERVVMDGTVALPVQWTAWKNGIYRLKTDKPVWQLFVRSGARCASPLPTRLTAPGHTTRSRHSCRARPDPGGISRLTTRARSCIRK